MPAVMKTHVPEQRVSGERDESLTHAEFICQGLQCSGEHYQGLLSSSPFKSLIQGFSMVEVMKVLIVKHKAVTFPASYLPSCSPDSFTRIVLHLWFLQTQILSTLPSLLVPGNLRKSAAQESAKEIPLSISLGHCLNCRPAEPGLPFSQGCDTDQY